MTMEQYDSVRACVQVRVHIGLLCEGRYRACGVCTRRVGGVCSPREWGLRVGRGTRDSVGKLSILGGENARLLTQYSNIAVL